MGRVLYRQWQREDNPHANHAKEKLCTWVCVGVRGYMWVYVGVHGWVWVYVGVRGYLLGTVMPGLSDTVCSQNTCRITEVAG